METFIDSSKYESLYSCAHLSAAQWRDHAVYRPNATLPCIVLGTFYAITYIPCIFVHLKKRFIHKPCHKLMFLLGLIDAASLAANIFTYGALYAEGVSFCQAPTLLYILGVVTQACWAGQCLTAVFLILCNLITMYSKCFSSKIFGGDRIFIFYGIVAVYMAYFAIFTKPLLFSSVTILPSYDPYAHIFGEVLPADRNQYFNWEALMNNIAFISFLMIALIVFVTIICRTKLQVKKGVQFMIMRQCLFICVLNMIPAASFIASQFTVIPEDTAYVLLVGWQFAIGGRGMLLLYFSKSFRQGFFDVIFNASSLSKSGVVEQSPVSNWM
ncbi:hypothetical protein QR680_015932 [Steinernema hermaphroditum]|uniref:Uncharacterized protein n=1 Tax=Steinernema hermaphroditum TaxID=289476 RepID=A0AA39HC02_9BILA|nr:hypothetical protein QR680_015932 [Steinernema hermaphroditum]